VITRPPGDQALRDLRLTLVTPYAYQYHERAAAAVALADAKPEGSERERVVTAMCAILDRTIQENIESRAGRGYWKAVFVSLPLAILLTCAGGYQALFPNGGRQSLDLLASASFLPVILPVILLVGAAVAAIGSLVLGAVIAPVAIPLSLIRDAGREGQVRRACAEALGRLAAPEAVGPLAMASMRVDRAEVGAAARSAFIPCVGALTAAHFGTVDGRAVQCICDMLHLASVEIKPAALRALEHVGDRKAVRPVRDYAHYAESAALKAEAARVYMVLVAREQKEMDPVRLLRPIEEPHQRDHTLLRSVSEAADASPEALLRPAMADEQREPPMDRQAVRYARVHPAGRVRPYLWAAVMAGLAGTGLALFDITQADEWGDDGFYGSMAALLGVAQPKTAWFSPIFFAVSLYVVHVVAMRLGLQQPYVEQDATYSLFCLLLIFPSLMGALVGAGFGVAIRLVKR
jgi:hypothetical protein